jgi:hypothetical protein
MSDRDEPTLDEEGVPDLDGPLPEKELTGDPQEGETPPGDRPRASVDWGTTANEQRLGEPLDIRIARELPEEGATDPADDVAFDLGLDDEPTDKEARRSDAAAMRVVGDDDDELS